MGNGLRSQAQPVSKDKQDQEEIPLQDSYKKPECTDEVRDEILYRKVLKPTKVPHAWEINKFS